MLRLITLEKGMYIYAPAVLDAPNQLFNQITVISALPPQNKTVNYPHPQQAPNPKLYPLSRAKPDKKNGQRGEWGWEGWGLGVRLAIKLCTTVSKT